MMSERVEKAFRELFDCLTSPVRPSTQVANERCEALIAAVREDERERCAATLDSVRGAEWKSEADRLRKLFDDAGQGEHNVLALIDHYQRNSMEADERLRAVRELLEANGCDCPCDHHPDERGPDCEVCLACLIGEAVGK